MTIKLWLPLPPSVNSMYKPTRKGVRLSKHARLYKERVGWYVNRLEPLAGHLEVIVHINAHNKSRDIDNCLKLLLDSIEKFAYLNDRQVARIHAHMYHDKASDEGVYVEIDEIRPMLNAIHSLDSTQYGIVED